MQPVSLAFFWHQHQPYYPDDVSGENFMPWVRLHGTKDYYGMALHIQEVPEFRCSINLVPSLLDQILAYTDRGGSDKHLDISRLPADSLSEADCVYLLNNFFMANFDSMIRPYSRYHELHLKRGFGIDPTEKAVPRFSTGDIRDLQVWSNLTWIHPLVFEIDSDLKAFLEKGQNWSEDEKTWLLEKQLEILKQVIPLHRKLADGGQLEITTTPYYHPILPLLWDKRSAREAMPGCQLPKYLDSYREDMEFHIKQGVEFHTDLFGKRPKGMWPSEGSVSQDILPSLSNAGIEWIATDEEILAESTQGWISRDHQGHLRHPEMLFRPWKVGEGDHELQIVFRDHAMSDLIGFHYQRSDPVHAAQDLLGRVKGIGRAVEANNGGRPALVPVILDGENCWEYYHDGGVKFLRSLYQSCVTEDNINPTRISDYLQEFPATDRINQLFAGSWISHNFAIWIGHEEDRTAWDYLHETREFLVEKTKQDEHPAEQLQKAWRELYIAQGSDWYWWFGDDHSCDQDALFDQLFRKHLQNVYTLLDNTYPAGLDNPISKTDHRVIHTNPTGFLPVKVDGRRTYFEWISAGHYVCGSGRGTMTLVTEGVIKDVYFGFDKENLFCRVDTAGRAADALKEFDELHLRFAEPSHTEIRISGIGSKEASGTLYRKNRAVSKAEVKVACDHILEMSVPFDDLKLTADDPIQMYFELFSGKQSIERAPNEGMLSVVTPSADFEQVMWQA